MQSSDQSLAPIDFTQVYLLERIASVFPDKTVYITPNPDPTEEFDLIEDLV